MRRIAVINQKGGVGKTTTSVNLAHALALQGQRVSLIDLDPQGHLSTCLALASREFDISRGMDAVLLEGEDIESVCCVLDSGVRVIPAGARLNEVEHLTTGGATRGMRLKEALQGRLADQDVLIIDCPPSSGLLAINALFAADEVLVPVVGDYLALCGVSQLMQTIRRFESISGKTLRTWFVLTRFHPRGRLAREVMDKLMRCFPGQVLGTAVRETVALAESPAHGKTIFEYRPKSHGAQDYQLLAQDLMQERAL